MRRKRKTKITVETHRVLVIRQRRSVVRAACERCAQPVEMLTVEEAAAVAGVTTRTIHRRVKAGKLHFTETPEGVRLICLNSLYDDRERSTQF